MLLKQTPILPVIWIDPPSSTVVLWLRSFLGLELGCNLNVFQLILISHDSHVGRITM